MTQHRGVNKIYYYTFTFQNLTMKKKTL